VQEPESGMVEFDDQSKRHLEEALTKQDPSEKDFHIRQVLQAHNTEQKQNNWSVELDSFFILYNYFSCILPN